MISNPWLPCIVPLQVFLTMSPEEVMQSLYALSSSTQQQYPSALSLAAQAPLLLQQHPAATSAALQQLRSLLPDQMLTQELLYAAPELLLTGPQLQQRMAAAAALLSLSVVQLAVALIKEPTLWWVLVPRHTWPVPGQQQQQQRVMSPATALAVESMAALQACKLRPPAVMQQVAVLHPLLLKLGAAAIQQRLHLLQDVCAKVGQWQQQLQASLHPELLGRAIMRIGVWHQRMEFLVQYGFAHRLQLSDVIALTRSDFEKNFSFDYSGWKLEGKHQRRRAAAAAAQQDRYGGSGGQDHHQQQQQQWEQQRRLAWLQQQALQRQQQRQQQRQPQVQQQQQQRPALLQQQLEDDFVGVLQAFAAGGGNAAAQNSSSSASRFASYAPDPGSNTSLQEQQQQQQRWQQQGEGEDAVYYLEEEQEEDEDYLTEQEGQEEDEGSSSSSNTSQSHSAGDRDATQQPHDQQHDESEFKPGWQMRRYTIMLADDKGRPETHVHTHVPLVLQSDKLLLSVQQSALELYGSWQGSLVQPRT
jgi:hypothetical protein